MRKFTVLLALLVFAGLQVVLAQKTITGTVTSSEDGKPIPGATVVVKNTTIGTTTNVDGFYELSVPDDATTLVFSYVGMISRQLPIGDATVINTVLELDVMDLEGVVVTALGITREKKSLGYAVSELSGEAVNEVRETNFVNSLSGKVSGVQIRQSVTMGGSANILIRGTTSLTQNNQALFVVDGIPINNNNTNEDRPAANETTAQQNDGWGGYDYGNAAMDINPDDIESISVLKGAAASALYGSRAANGVILITTKKGTKAPGKGIGVTLNVGYQASMVDKTTLPQHQDKYGGGYGPFYENETGDPATDYFFFVGDVDGDGTDDWITPTAEDASWGAEFNPDLMIVQWDALDPLGPNFGEKRPWVAAENGIDYFFSTGHKWTTNVAFDGATDDGSFRLSYTNVDEKGYLVNSSIKKNILNFGGNYNFTKKLSVDANITYVNTKGVGRYGTGYDGLNPMQSFGQWFQRNVDLKRLEERYLRPDGSQLSWNCGYWDDLRPIYFDNPYWTRFKNYEDDERDRTFGYAALNYQFTDWLTFTGRFSIDQYNEIQNERIAQGSVDPSYYSNFTNSFKETNYDLMLKYNHRWEDFSLAGIVGTNFRQNVVQNILGETVGGIIVPDLYSISNSVSPVNIVENLRVSGVNSGYISASLGYKDFVYLDLTDRYDVSSTLPEGNNAYNYYSASVSLLLTELGGLQDLSWMPFLKVRANYAEVGNDAPPYSTISTYSQGTSWGDLALFSVNSTLQNPDLLPERTKSYEFGLEGRLLNNRISFDVATYKSNTFDQIMPVRVTTMSGYTFRFVNGGEIENKGWEVSLLGTVVKTTDFSWDIGVNWFTNKNKVISLYEDVDNLLIYSAWDVSVNATVGEPYGTIKGTDFVYTDGKKTVNDNGYYMVSESGEEVLGNINPDWNMGIPTRISYKGVALNLLVDIQQGGDIYSVGTKYGEATGLYQETAEDNDKGNPMRWLVADGGGYLYPETVYEDGTPNTTYVEAYRWGRAFYYNNSPTARYVFDASYVKLREVALSYSLPMSMIENSPLTQVTFSLVGRNLWIISKNTVHFDPETGLSSGNQQGIESGSWPSARTFGFNVKLGF